LEHPAESLAWPAFKLARPRRGAWSAPDLHGGRVAEVSQAAYGHRARKRTWLYYVGSEPSALNWASPPPVATVSWMSNHGGGVAPLIDERPTLFAQAQVGRMRKQAPASPGDVLPRLGKREASATPPAFRDVLLDLARNCGGPVTR
jgi:hypothetical protein